MRRRHGLAAKGFSSRLHHVRRKLHDAEVPGRNGCSKDEEFVLTAREHVGGDEMRVPSLHDATQHFSLPHPSKMSLPWIIRRAYIRHYPIPFNVEDSGRAIDSVTDIDLQAE